MNICVCICICICLRTQLYLARSRWDPGEICEIISMSPEELSKNPTDSGGFANPTNFHAVHVHVVITVTNDIKGKWR